MMVALSTRLETALQEVEYALQYGCYFVTADETCGTNRYLDLHLFHGSPKHHTLGLSHLLGLATSVSEISIDAITSDKLFNVSSA